MIMAHSRLSRQIERWTDGHTHTHTIKEIDAQTSAVDSYASTPNGLIGTPSRGTPGARHDMAGTGISHHARARGALDICSMGGFLAVLGKRMLKWMEIAQ